MAALAWRSTFWGALVGIASAGPFISVSGNGCEVSGTHCLVSSRRRRYGNWESCRVEVAQGAGPITVHEFSTESCCEHDSTQPCCDYLTVSNAVYEGRSGPAGIQPGRIITWTTDRYTSYAGWTICAEWTTTTTTTRTTTTTTMTCLHGHGLQAGKCEPCPEGHMADFGLNPCLPVLAYVVARLPEPTFSVEADGYGAARIAFDLGELPESFYEAYSLAYHFDMGENSTMLQANSACGRLFARHGGRSYAALLSYGDLAGTCRLAVRFSAENVSRSGFAAALLVASPAAGGGEAFTVQRWLFAVSVAFPARVQALQQHLLASADRLREGGSALTGPIPATLGLFESEAFSRHKALASFKAGDRAFLSLALSAAFASFFDVAVTAVWLSRSSSPTAQALHELSGSLESLASLRPSGRGARFSIKLQACADCWLHASGALSLPARRLGEAARTAHAVVAVTVLDDLVAKPAGGSPAWVRTVVNHVERQVSDLAAEGTPWWWAMLVTVAAAMVVGMMAWIGVRYRRSIRTPVPPSARTEPALPPPPVPLPRSPATSPALRLVTDPNMVRFFQRMVGRAADFRRGVDLRFETAPPHTSLRFLSAWEIHSPDVAGEYLARKNRVKHEVAKVAAGSAVTFPTVRTELADLQKVLAFDLLSDVNEVMLLHGTSWELVLTIAYTGVSEKFSGGLFGQGAYLAENAAKTDQYAVPLQPHETVAGSEELRQRLFTSCGLQVPTECCFFLFVCTVALGCPAHTKDGTKTIATGDAVSLPAGMPIFATGTNRELAEFPGTVPPIRAHSLIAETGGIIRRFREFVVFHQQGILPRYVLAYSRV